MKKKLQKFWDGVKKIFTGKREEKIRLVTIAIKIVEGIKKVQDSPLDDIVLGIITGAIPGDADDKLVARLQWIGKLWIPKILRGLYLTKAVAEISDPDEQLKAIIVELNASAKETKKVIYHGLCALIAEKLADGKLTWSEAIEISEAHYKNKLNE